MKLVLPYSNSNLAALYIEYDESILTKANETVISYIDEMTKSLALK
ncbi:MAG: hypothetical protein PHE33_08195 [Bacteroidales bacterium]|nr:hypothetical protein [Bacteroidales bacterium]